MRITQVRELAVKLQGGVANAVVNFSEHTASLVAVVSDVIRAGRPVVGIGFNSIGRFAQSGIIRDRMIPRLMAAPPSSVLDASGDRFDAAKVLATIMRNEKPGGHGDRAGATAGNQGSPSSRKPWIPASAGMTRMPWFPAFAGTTVSPPPRE